MQSVVDRSLASDRFITALLSLFAAVALVLAVVGIYGILSYSVTSRFREMGLRIALGGSAGSVIGLVMGRSLALVAGGIVLGFLGALALTRGMGSLLFGVSPTDPVTLSVVILLLAVVGAVASLIPARRAGRVDPVQVLKVD